MKTRPETADIHDEAESFAGGHCPVIFRSRTIDDYAVYLDKPISKPSLYREVIKTFEEAGPTDSVTIIINTPGGQLGTTTAIINAIQTCRGKVCAKIEGMAASAGSLIALSCPEVEVMPFSRVMIHPASTVIGGALGDILTYAEFVTEEVNRLYKTVYSGFLTEAELDLVTYGNKELWFNDEETAKRLQRMYEYRYQLEKEAEAEEEASTDEPEEAA